MGPKLFDRLVNAFKSCLGTPLLPLSPLEASALRHTSGALLHICSDQSYCDKAINHIIMEYTMAALLVSPPGVCICDFHFSFFSFYIFVNSLNCLVN